MGNQDILSHNTIPSENIMPLALFMISSNLFQDIISKEVVNIKKLSIPGNTSLPRATKTEGWKKPTHTSDTEMIRYGI